jgi:RNA polymerase sigma factor (TIGR02999 family)
VKLHGTRLWHLNYTVAMSEITQILDAIDRGDSQGTDKLWALVYDELRMLAASQLAKERPGQTLQPTALMHEAYLRLVGGDQSRGWQSRGQFFAAAATAMRRILVESARRKRRLKRGGDLVRQDFDAELIAAPQEPDELLALDEALDRFAQVDPVAARLVELRYFAGLSSPESAGILDISPRTADRLWAYARAWLHDAIGRE